MYVSNHYRQRIKSIQKMKIQIEISKGKNVTIKYRVDITNNIRGDRTENRKVQKTFFFFALRCNSPTRARAAYSQGF